MEKVRRPALKKLAADPNLPPRANLVRVKAAGHRNASYLPHQGSREVLRRQRQALKREEKTAAFNEAVGVAQSVYDSLVSRDTNIVPCEQCGATNVPEQCPADPQCKYVQPK